TNENKAIWNDIKNPLSPLGKTPWLYKFVNEACPNCVSYAIIIIVAPTTINASIVIILIIANQNSNSPNSLALNKLSDISTRTQNKALNQFGISANQKLTYFATAVTSAIPVIIQHSQYVHPVTKPANAPMCLLVTSAKDLKLVFVTSISPKPRININSIKPMMIYVSKIEGPVKAIVWPAPKNNPVPIAPSIAISWM